MAVLSILKKNIEKAQSFIYIKCLRTNRKSDAKDRIFYVVSFTNTGSMNSEEKSKLLKSRN